MSTLIEHAYDCSIRRYIDFAFLDKRNALTIEGEPTADEIDAAWEQICIEFTDYSSERLDSDSWYRKRTFQLKQHIACVNDALALQHACLEVTGEPLMEGFTFFHKAGHKLTWNGDLEHFRQQLKRVSTMEKSKVLMLAEFEMEYKQYQASNKKQTLSKQQQFSAFIELLNTLKFKGYAMDKDKDTLMDLAVVVKSFSKQVNNNQN